MSPGFSRFTGRHFYPRSPCGERPPPFSARTPATNFYPRSPCGERPRRSCQTPPGCPPFLSTLSLRRATAPDQRHALLLCHFYPRSPCGERRGHHQVIGHIRVFLSTLSLRRATARRATVLPVGSWVEIVSLRRATARRATAKVHKTVGHFCAYETNFMGIASSC